MVYQETAMVRQVLERLYWEEKRGKKIQNKPLLLCSMSEAQESYAQLAEEELFNYGVDDFNKRFWGEYYSDSHFLKWKGNKPKMVDMGLPVHRIADDRLLKGTKKDPSTIWRNFWFIPASFSAVDYQLHLPEMPPQHNARTLFVFSRFD